MPSEVLFSNDVLYDVFAFLTRSELDSVAIVSRQYYRVSRYFSTFPYRIINKMKISIFRDLQIEWDTPRLLTKHLIKMGISKGIRRSLYTYEQNLACLKSRSVKVKNACIMLSSFYNKPEIVQKLQALSHLWRESDLWLEGWRKLGKEFFSRLFSKDESWYTLWQCHSLTFSNRLCITDYPYAINGYKITYFQLEKYGEQLHCLKHVTLSDVYITGAQIIEWLNQAESTCSLSIRIDCVQVDGARVNGGRTPPSDWFVFNLDQMTKLAEETFLASSSERDYKFSCFFLSVNEVEGESVAYFANKSTQQKLRVKKCLFKYITTYDLECLSE